jgi:hypothetical protein
MTKIRNLSVSIFLTAAALWAQPESAGPLIVTASNTSTNQLLVYDSTGKPVQTVSTQGQGGAGGNAGGISAQGDTVAVVNFGSKTVAIFQRLGGGFQFRQSVPTASSPLSVAFGHGHLYVLGATKVESHQIFGSFVSTSPDGVVPLRVADGSAAQVGVVENQLIVTEKSNVIETVSLTGGGAVTGTPSLVANIPANVNAPFGLVTRGDDAYVTIAHADEISLVRHDTVLTVTPSGTQHAPCWLTLVGPFLFSSNSPSSSVSRYAVYGQKIVQDAAVAATFQGSPTDIASGDGLVAVVDGFTTPSAGSHLTIFSVDEDGVLTSKGVVTTTAPLNGVAIVTGARLDD